jgi:UDP-3-O-[3-hydroxymyristoyl] glucosamine N-acyltransferase
LASIVGGTLIGEPSLCVSGVADVEEAKPTDVTWLTNPKYADKICSSEAGVALVPVDFGDAPMATIVCDHVERSVAKLLGAFAPADDRPPVGIHPSAVVHTTARIGEKVAVGPNVVIGEGVEVGVGTVLHAGVFLGRNASVGDDCVFWPNVVVRDGCRVGHRVIIHPNSVIGADGLGFYFDGGAHQKVPHIGGVILEDDVEVGACSCIDRSKFGNTIVGKGTKIDNLVQIAHNVRIGEHCVMAAHTGIAGSVRIGRGCLFGGRATVIDHLTIGDGASLAGGLAVATKNVPAGQMVSGFPARAHRQNMREQANMRRLPDVMAQMKDLILRVEQLEASMHHQP